MTDLLDSAPKRKYWVIVPAAGVGSRMMADRPKQYLPLAGKTVIEHTLNKLLTCKQFDTLLVGLSPEDCYWDALPVSRNDRIIRYDGGRERVDTVLNGLYAILGKAEPDDWVLVHDVARPCVTIEDIDRLIRQLNDSETGGILGVPVADTVKRVERGCIVDTVDRSCLWRAYTPQMFRYQTLLNALEKGLKEGLQITDEASAIEALGVAPEMVLGSAENIKITQPGDLELAEIYLSRENKTDNK
ncbi:2-C-methyl-D-erythritol 4-phosphate cytidylyltransferase [Alkalimarinus coralli]|uniref:2-C-methyl-D-erythritol 4-phosphate cytidylyltransferase n=1 Tax=Alkalimarinus coralli TaxID=2935863 RepID=UPI00202B6D5B|nr:2-C-methyl-D-erythritol 4-phosphate cytidylyltransferase [Alkalimarinus coralli]